MTRSRSIWLTLALFVNVISISMQSGLCQVQPDMPAQGESCEQVDTPQPSTASLSNDQRPDLDKQLYKAAWRLDDFKTLPSDVLRELERLISLGATTNAFPHHELDSFNLGFVLSRRFFRQDLTKAAPDEPLFGCIKALMAAEGPIVLNREYVGNGGITCMEQLDKFLVTWAHPIFFNSIVPSEDRAQRFFDQCIELEELTRHNRVSDGWECRACFLLHECSFREKQEAAPAYIVKHIIQFLKMDLVENRFGAVDDLSKCCQAHEPLAKAFGKLDSSILKGIVDDSDLASVLLRMVLLTPESRKAFLNSMQASPSSRKNLAYLLKSHSVAVVLGENASAYDALVCELVRRRDLKSLTALLQNYVRATGPSGVPAEFAKLRQSNLTHNLCELLRRHGYNV